MSDCQDICQRLRSTDIEELREAAFEAGDRGCIEAVPQLCGLITSDNLGVQEAVDMTLRKLRGKEVVAGVIPLLRSEEAPIRNIAMDILRETGDEDFPALIALLHDPDPDIRIFASDILGSTGNASAVAPLCDALLKDPEVNVRYQAAVSLGDLGLRQAAQGLNKALDDEEWVQFAVIEALSKIRDASSVNALVKALDKSSDLVASMIVDALGEIGNIKAVTMLLRRIDAAPTVLRNKIVKAVVGILGGKSLALLSAKERERFREYLLAALKDDDEDIQDAAVDGLAFVGGADASASMIRLASKIDQDAEPERLDRIISALAAIGLTGALETCLESNDQAEVRVCVEALSRTTDPKVTALLMSVFWEATAERKRDVISALIRVAGPEAKDFFLDILTKVEDESILIGALRYLGRMRVDDAGEKVFGLLAHEADEVKEAALEACVDISGPEMNERFRELFKSEDPINRLMATYALGKLGVKNNMDEIVRALEDEVPDIRKIAIEAVSDLCADHKEGLSFIVSRLYDENREVRLAVVEQIGHCDAPEGVPYLLEALADADDWVRVRAMEALGARREIQAVGKIIPLTRDKSALAALKAVETLGEIGGEAAFRALLGIVDGDDPELQAAAETAIAKIQDEQGA